MARDFAGATHKVDFGSGTSIDDVFTGTVAAWVWQDTNTAAQQILDKAPSGADNTYAFRFLPSGGVLFNIARATTSLRIEVTGANLPTYATGKWLFVAATFDQSGVNGDQIAYSGDLTTAADAAASYVIQRVGSGAATTNASVALTAGQQTVDAEFPLDGRIAWIGLWNRQLSLSELRNQQYRPHVTNGCLLFSHLGLSATDEDWSGNGNAGTPTDTVVIAHPPLRFTSGKRINALADAGSTFSQNLLDSATFMDELEATVTSAAGPGFNGFSDTLSLEFDGTREPEDVLTFGERLVATVTSDAPATPQGDFVDGAAWREEVYRRRRVERQKVWV